MTRKEALAELIEKVEAGEWDAAGFSRALSYDDCRRLDAYRAYEGSLDAAKALHEAVLPGWEWHLGPSNAKIYPYNGSPVKSWDGMADTPARAWLIAILRALYARETDT